jgi:N-acetylglucosaminyldiphosphoundecaprenol N-acetyl-beta-D-mannosaminyltransferase
MVPDQSHVRLAHPVRHPLPTEPRGSRLFEDADVDPLETTSLPNWDDFSRNVYCVLGVPVDAIDMPTLLRAVHDAAASKTPFLISTPNLNFLVTSQRDPEFRETLLLSEMCPADGMPVVWIARLIGLPIKERVAGSDMMEELRRNDNSAPPLKLFLFGGDEGAAEAAARALNRSSSGLSCVGTLFPGFGSVEEMSQDCVIDQINASHADFLIAALGAKKGQAWLQRNHDRLQIPVRSHLGAVVNFAAGNVKRAPSTARKIGLEWLWRIKEEPHLWRRYLNDGAALLGLLITCVLPLAIQTRWQRVVQRGPKELVMECTQDFDCVSLSIAGAATARNVHNASAAFRKLVAIKKEIRIDLSNTSCIDARFLGLLLMLRKVAKKQGVRVRFLGISSRLETTFRLNRVGFLLDGHRGG